MSPRLLPILAPFQGAFSPGARATSVQTEIAGSISEVKFHLSCQPGDNYRFKASVTVPVYNALEGTSDLVTVWRKLHVERDSMGLAIGPFDCDPEPTSPSGIECDAVIGDVPDPILDFMVNAFKPAYIDVVLPPDTGADTGDVRFQYNVPNTADDINAQAKLGRASISTAGRWIVYDQGAYDADLLRDNDPNSELGLLGVTANHRNSLTFIETIRDTSNEFSTDNQYNLSMITIHEFGHQFILGDILLGMAEPVKEFETLTSDI